MQPMCMVMQRAAPDAGGLPRWEPPPGRARPHRAPAVDVASTPHHGEARRSPRLLREMCQWRELSLDPVS